MHIIMDVYLTNPSDTTLSIPINAKSHLVKGGLSSEWESGNVLLSQEGGSGAFKSTALATGTSQAMLESG